MNLTTLSSRWGRLGTREPTLTPLFTGGKVVYCLSLPERFNRLDPIRVMVA
jgi:hypothetical protein